MNKNLIIGVIVLLVLVGVGYYIFTKYKAPSLAPELPQPPTPFVTPAEVTIKITDQDFEPKEVEITKGTKVTWVNESSKPSWPASDEHPTHRVYPGSGIEKCGTSEQVNIFDACRGLNKGESWSFIFNEVGEWYYHDHLNPSKTGEIVVK